MSDSGWKQKNARKSPGLQALGCFLSFRVTVCLPGSVKWALALNLENKYQYLLVDSWIGLADFNAIDLAFYAAGILFSYC